MHTSTETKKLDERSLTQSALGLLRHYLGGRRGTTMLAAAAGADEER